jgi:hypothetical protein
MYCFLFLSQTWPNRPLSFLPRAARPAPLLSSVCSPTAGVILNRDQELRNWTKISPNRNQRKSQQDRRLPMNPRRIRESLSPSRVGWFWPLNSSPRAPRFFKHEANHRTRPRSALHLYIVAQAQPTYNEFQNVVAPPFLVPDGGRPPNFLLATTEAWRCRVIVARHLRCPPKPREARGKDLLRLRSVWSHSAPRSLHRSPSRRAVDITVHGTVMSARPVPLPAGGCPQPSIIW